MLRGSNVHHEPADGRAESREGRPRSFFLKLNCRQVYFILGANHPLRFGSKDKTLAYGEDFLSALENKERC